jgi:hypothetical protein
VERIIEGFSALADHHLASIERDRLLVAKKWRSINSS